MSVLDSLLDARLEESWGKPPGQQRKPFKPGGGATVDARNRLRQMGRKLPPAPASWNKARKGSAQQGHTGGTAAYDESKHRRAPKGAAGGGRFISTGSSGAEVGGVQRAVGAKADGKYGPETRRAIMEFQRQHGLQVDGVVGRQTLAALEGDKRAEKVAVGALRKGDMKRLRALKKGSARRKGRRGRSGAPQRSGGGVIV